MPLESGRNVFAETQSTLSEPFLFKHIILWRFVRPTFLTSANYAACSVQHYAPVGKCAVSFSLTQILAEHTLRKMWLTMIHRCPQVGFRVWTLSPSSLVLPSIPGICSILLHRENRVCCQTRTPPAGERIYPCNPDIVPTPGPCMNCFPLGPFALAPMETENKWHPRFNIKILQNIKRG